MRRLAFIAILAAVTPLHAADYIVPDDYPTIQAAVDAAQENDRILVRARTYLETVRIRQSELSIEGFDGVPTLAPSRGRDGFIQRKRSGVEGDLLISTFKIIGARTAVDCQGCAVTFLTVSDATRGVRSVKRRGAPSPNGGVVASTFSNVRRQCVVFREGAAVGGSTFDACGEDAIVVSGGATDILLNNVADAGGNGIRVATTDTARVTGNVVLRSRLSGIVVKASPLSGVFHSDVARNTSNDNARFGFDTNEEIPDVASSNTATGNGIANIRTRGGVQ